MKLLLLADTHLPKRARDLPAAVWAAIDDADVVVHAGDWVDVETLDRVEARGPRLQPGSPSAKRLVGVWGNNDGEDLRSRLPETARFSLDGVRFAVTHETGARQGREARCDTAFPDVDVLVFGHSHIPWDTTTPAGLRLLNPGSPTDRRRQPHCTFMTASVLDGRLTDVHLHAIPASARPR